MALLCKLLFTVAFFVLFLDCAEPDPLGPTEQYLKPFLDTIVGEFLRSCPSFETIFVYSHVTTADYRKDQVAEEYIFLYELVDVLPSWLSDLFIPLLIPGSQHNDSSWARLSYTQKKRI